MHAFLTDIKLNLMSMYINNGDITTLTSQILAELPTLGCTL